MSSSYQTTGSPMHLTHLVSVLNKLEGWPRAAGNVHRMLDEPPAITQCED